jgi:hypothetical protein
MNLRGRSPGAAAELKMSKRGSPVMPIFPLVRWFALVLAENLAA